MGVLAVTITERGRALAAGLPFECAHGGLAETVRARWGRVEGFVLFVATGVAVRVIAPLLASKETDPAVVCVDDAGRFAVALSGGHAAGANALAHQVAALLDATPVVTTATDATSTPALDQVPGLVAAGDVSGVTVALLDGRPPLIERRLEWPLPPWLTSRPGPERPPERGEGPERPPERGDGPERPSERGDGPERPSERGDGPERPPERGDGPERPPERRAGQERIVLSDHALPFEQGQAVLHPPSLVAGVGSSTGAPAAEVEALLHQALDDAGLARASVAEVATIDRRAGEPAIVGLGLPVRTFTADALAHVAVPSPSSVVAAAVGTPSVAEAAALLAAGPGAHLVVTKRASAHATVAVARRSRPRGHLSLVGLGPGAAAHRTPAADAAVRNAEIVIGYTTYVEQVADLLRPGQEVVRSPIGEEVVRAKQALADASAGRRVAMVCSGDAGVYAMAAVVLELADDPALPISVIPGVTAGLASAALLGAPLGHDHVLISLSDLHTPWETIARRLRAAAQADLVVVLYNPRSMRRTRQLDAARAILLTGRPADTPVGLVADAGRRDERVTITTLAGFQAADVDMTTCVIIGSSTTRVISGRMVTPRGLVP